MRNVYMYTLQLFNKAWYEVALIESGIIHMF